MLKNYEPASLCRPELLSFSGWMISFWAGSINMIASFSILFSRVSHMTGPTSDLSRFLATDMQMALFMGLVVFSFVFGAFMAAVVARSFKVTVNLMFSTIPVFLSVLLLSTNPSFLAGGGSHFFAILLPLGMGWQNGATSQCKIGRTTHVTGDITDIGLAIAQGDWTKARYFSVKFSGHVIGGMTGLFLMGFNGALALLVSASGIVLTGLAINAFDYQHQLSKQRTADRVPSAEPVFAEMLTAKAE